jgi:hypothetical protein
MSRRSGNEGTGGHSATGSETLVNSMAEALAAVFVWPGQAGSLLVVCCSVRVDGYESPGSKGIWARAGAAVSMATVAVEASVAATRRMDMAVSDQRNRGWFR